MSIRETNSLTESLAQIKLANITFARFRILSGSENLVRLGLAPSIVISQRVAAN